MQDLRIILIILGAVAIAALLIHGLWTSQKGRQAPMRDKPLGKVAAGNGEGDDFDRDGVGKVRVVSSRKPAPAQPRDEEDDWQPAPGFSALADDDDDEPRLGLTPEAPVRPKAAPVRPVPVANAAGPAPEPEEDEEDEQALRERRYHRGDIDPLFDHPAPRAAAPAAQARAEPKAKVAPVAPPEPQPAADPVPEPVPEPRPEPVLRQVPRTWQDVYVINLMARPNQQLLGPALMRALTANGFHFGDMDIFHRHQTPAGQGEVVFSLINMVKPGTFNPEAMSGFASPGVSIFMQLPRPGMAKNQFNLMVQTAENLAEELDALLFDAERSPLSPDYLAHCREQLRDYDSQVQ